MTHWRHCENLNLQVGDSLNFHTASGRYGICAARISLYVCRRPIQVPSSKLMFRLLDSAPGCYHYSERWTSYYPDLG